MISEKFSLSSSKTSLKTIGSDRVGYDVLEAKLK